MKFEIDLNDILGDEFGVETLADSVRRQVVDNLSKTLQSSIRDKITDEVNEVISTTVKQEVIIIIPELIQNLLNEEYFPVDRYGDRSRKPTTFRKEITQAVSESFTYTKNRYSSGNAFTNAVNSIIEENVKELKASFDKTVTEGIAKEAYASAIKTLQTKLGLTA